MPTRLHRAVLWFSAWPLALALLCPACGSDDGTAPATSDASADSGGCKQDGAPCDDGNACTSSDACKSGVCSGTAKTCDDGLPCTTDACDPASGCTVTVASGQCAMDGACHANGTAQPGNPCRTCQPALDAVGWSDAATSCDDASVCTQQDACKNGTCQGVPQPCNDSNPCTTDSCDPKVGCQFAPNGLGCDDGNPCTSGDTCAAGLCHGATATVCDDKDSCTLDTCETAKGCVFPPDPTACNDGKPCTQDLCDKISGCSHASLQPGDSCSSGDPCVSGQVCSLDLACKGGSPLACDDKNPCTTDSCKAGVGCVHTLNKAPCNDGEPCTKDDQCTGGVCIGVKGFSCTKCTNADYSTTAGKLTQFQIGGSGKPGEGFDVDGNPKTCAPADACEAGIDNASAVLGPFINKALVAGVQDGSLSFVAEFKGYDKPGKPFVLNLYGAELTAGAQSAGCKPLAEVCAWNVLQTALTAQCKPKFSFQNAIIQGGKLTAGDKDTLFAMQSELIGAKNATLYVKGARIEGTVTMASDGIHIQAMQGILGGALPMESLVDVINASADSAFSAIGFDKATVLQLIQQVLTLDLDLDGDKVPDAASIGIRFTAIGAQIAGTEP
jgi:hypothetical protein